MNGGSGHGWRRRALIAVAAAAGLALVSSSLVIATLSGPPHGHGIQSVTLSDGSTAKPSPPPSAAWVRRSLRGSPRRLAALHRDGGRLVTGDLAARLRSLRGYPVVLNAWASWCGPCREELPLMSRAAGRFGRRVAFLGADVDDSAGSAQRLLAGKHLSYPSFRTSATTIRALTPIVGFPTTVYMDRQGKVVFTHQGQYSTAGRLAADVRRFALGGADGG